MRCRPLRYRSDLPKTGLAMFRHAIVGQSKRTTWYQYGLTTPQVPYAPQEPHQARIP